MWMLACSKRTVFRRAHRWPEQAKWRKLRPSWKASRETTKKRWPRSYSPTTWWQPSVIRSKMCTKPWVTLFKATMKLSLKISSVPSMRWRERLCQYRWIGLETSQSKWCKGQQWTWKIVICKACLWCLVRLWWLHLWWHRVLCQMPPRISKKRRRQQQQLWEARKNWTTRWIQSYLNSANDTLQISFT